MNSSIEDKLKQLESIIEKTREQNLKLVDTEGIQFFTHLYNDRLDTKTRALRRSLEYHLEGLKPYIKIAVRPLKLAVKDYYKECLKKDRLVKCYILRDKVPDTDTRSGVYLDDWYYYWYPYGSYSDNNDGILKQPHYKRKVALITKELLITLKTLMDLPYPLSIHTEADLFNPMLRKILFMDKDRSIKTWEDFKIAGTVLYAAPTTPRQEQQSIMWDVAMLAGTLIDTGSTDISKNDILDYKSKNMWKALIGYLGTLEKGIYGY